MILILDPNGTIIAICKKAERVNEQGEENLIKVWPTDDIESFWYIGTADRDSLSIDTIVADVPEGVTTWGGWKYLDGKFIEPVNP